MEGFDPTRFSRLLNSRGLFVGFAEHFTKDGDTRPGARSAAAHVVAPGWTLTDAMLDEFHQYLVDQKIRVDEAAFKTDRAFIKAMIHFEVDVDLFGMAEARRAETAVDPQLQTALGYFNQARALLSLPAQGAGRRVAQGVPPAGGGD